MESKPAGGPERRRARRRARRRFIRLSFALALAGLAFAAEAQNVDRQWDHGGGNQDWSEPLNWSGDVLPATGTGNNGDNLHFNTPEGSHAVYDEAQGTNIYRLIRIGDSTNLGVLEVTGGKLSSDSTTATRIATGGRMATLKQSGGTLSFGGYMQVGLDANSMGNILQSGGTLISARDGTVAGIPRVSLVLGDGNNAQGNYLLSGGEFRTRSGMLLGNPTTAGKGRFEVRGGGTASIGTENAADDGFWVQSPGSTLAAFVTNGQLGTILVDDLSGPTGTYSDGNVIFMPGALLEVGFLDAPVNGSWDLMRWRGALLTNGLAFAPSVTDPNWSFAFVDTDAVGGPDTLRITYSMPGVPSGLTAKAGLAQVALSWNNVSNATGYDVKRSLSEGGPFVTVAATSTNGFVDSGLTNGVTYHYVVASIIDGGESADSTVVSAIPTRFVHPGGLFKLSDMERMRFMVQAGVEPWVTSFNTLKTDSKASYLYAVQGDPSWTDVSRDPPSTHKSQYESDVTAAYLNALMWIVTQDARHADKCVEIFNTWRNLQNVQGGGTESLNGGLYAWKLVEAAEIIRSTYPGWAPADVQGFKEMLVYPGYSSTTVPSSVNTTNGTFYWRIYRGDPGRHGNQDLIAWRAMIVMGVFLDNEMMYDRALRYFKGLPGRTDDIPMPSGPSPSGSQVSSNQYFIAYQYLGSQGTIPDYGYNGVLTNYVWENGQNQESSRDQQHAFFGLGICAGISEVAWNQGDDVWNAASNRLLLGFEFMSKYNTSFIASFPDQPVPWEPADFIQRTDRTGRWFSQSINPTFESDFVSLSRGNFAGTRPVYEQAAAHFDTRMGLGDAATWTLRGRDVAITNSGYETTGWSLDHPGWGGLCFRRPVLAAGDPISGFDLGLPVFGMPRLPGWILAANYDWFPADGEGRTYHDLTPTNTGGAYRTDGVDVASDPEDGEYVTDMAAGEWLAYTIDVPANGTYGIAVRYAAAVSGGTIRLSLGTNDITGEIPLPATGGPANWEDHAVAPKVNLPAGVNVLRLHVGGTSDAFNLKGISISPSLSAVPQGDTLWLSWPRSQPGWQLETQTNALAVGLTGNWQPVPGSEMTNQFVIPFDSAAACIFFRLKQP